MNITCDEPFPRHVFHERHPALLEKILAAHPYPPRVRSAVSGLLDETLSGPMRRLPDDTGEWDAPYYGSEWSAAPFFWAESYFYRRLLDAVGYFDAGPWGGLDPFAFLKAAELRDADLPVDALPVEALLSASLWGNRADLSFRIGVEAVSGRAGPAARLVADDTPAVLAVLDRGLTTVVLVADNAGRELLADLVLVDHLLSTGRARRIVVHVKPRPHFVSDATTADVVDCLGALDGVGDRLRQAAAEGRLEIATHRFYCAPLTFAEMPPDLFGDASLVILKGDLNYRRLVGDRHWPPTTPFAATVGYFPAPVVALRTLKSDVVVGLEAATVAALDAEAGDWRTSGTYALVQALF